MIDAPASTAELAPPAAPAGQGFSVSERLRLIRNGLLNYLAVLFAGLVGILLVPILMQRLDAAEFGVWIAALALVGMVGALEFGINVVVVREVAAAAGRGSDCTHLIRGAAAAMAVFALAGAAMIAGLGVPLSENLHLQGALRQSAWWVFLLAAGIFIADRFLSFSYAILTGLQRFGTIAAFSAASVSLRTAGILAVLFAGGGVVAVAAWVAIAALVVATSALLIVRRTTSLFQWGWEGVDWELLRPHGVFGLASQATTALGSTVWQTAPFLIGIFNGAAAIVPYHVGQKFPLSVAAVYERFGAVLFPAASEYQGAEDHGSSRGVFEFGTRMIVLLVLPVCIVLVVVAPALLAAWLGDFNPAAVQVLRLSVLAVFFEAAAAAALQMLWGRGRVQVLFTISAITVALNVGLGYWWLRYGGITGPAWALCAVTGFAAATAIVCSARDTGHATVRLLQRTFAGMPLPALMAAATAWGVLRLLAFGGWVPVMMASALSGTVFMILFYGWGARPEEKAMLRWVGAAVADLARDLGRKIPALRSTRYLLIELKRWRRGRVRPDEYDAEFSGTTDPYGYRREAQQRRFELALSLLKELRPGSPRVLEIGCAEGHFTELVAPMCGTLLATDWSEAALQRARARCGRFTNVRFEKRDCWEEGLAGEFDLVLVMDVLDSYYRRGSIEAARAAAARWLAPGGHLLVTINKRHPVVENAWWAGALLRGRHVLNFIAAHPEFELDYSGGTDTHWIILCHRRAHVMGARA